MTIVSASNILDDSRQESVATTIGDRLSQELVIALVGPVGSGVSTAASYLKEILTQTFSYDVCPIIKPSTIIKEEAPRVGLKIPEGLALDNYIQRMQDAGNALREKFGSNYLAEKIVEKIIIFRTSKGGYTSGDVVLPGRRAYIIDSLKNPDELSLLKQIYGETLCVVGIFAPDAKRSERLKDLGVPETQIRSIMDRDQGGVMTFGQKTRKIFVLSDFFVCNDRKADELRSKILRFLNIAFDTVIHTPTRSESAMYEASASASNSACMSRQVGAAIVSRDGELISVGWNDVPRFGGGLYNEDDQYTYKEGETGIIDADHRCFKWGGCICHNETRRVAIVDKIISKIERSGMLKRGVGGADLKDLLQGTEIDSRGARP